MTLGYSSADIHVNSESVTACARPTDKNAAQKRSEHKNPPITKKLFVTEFLRQGKISFLQSGRILGINHTQGRPWAHEQTASTTEYHALRQLLGVFVLFLKREKDHKVG